MYLQQKIQQVPIFSCQHGQKKCSFPLNNVIRTIILETNFGHDGVHGPAVQFLKTVRAFDETLLPVNTMCVPFQFDKCFSILCLSLPRRRRFLEANCTAPCSFSPSEAEVSRHYGILKINRNKKDLEILMQGDFVTKGLFIAPPASRPCSQ